MSSKRSSRKRKSPASLETIDGYNKLIQPSFCSVQKITPRNQGKQDCLDQALSFCEKVMEETSSQDYLTLLRCLHDYGTGNMTMVDLKIRIADYFPSFMDDFIRVLEFYGGEKDDVGKKKAEEEIDDGSLTESYRFLPKEVAGIHSSGTTELGKQVLNSICYCEQSSSSAGPRSMSPTEEKMNEREDKLFIIDMWKAWMRSTKENATKLDRAIRDGVIQNPKAEHVDSHFPGYNIKFIVKLYGKDGWSRVDRLRDDPRAFLPILIRRLDRMEIQTLPH
ncbi:hypothetical protein V6N13_072885 [Hibiscus sabdariffa]|uniref:Histone deacetylase interacting domain-containing protein n=1 Tax=Hibiscus sabdariffa TaxID=183260 RepID=A0ABR2E7G3_9ROSI